MNGAYGGHVNVYLLLSAASGKSFRIDMTTIVRRMRETQSINQSIKVPLNVNLQAGDTLLHNAASGGHADLCRILISQGSNVHAKNNVI